jgi:hypothetical protein
MMNQKSKLFYILFFRTASCYSTYANLLCKTNLVSAMCYYELKICGCCGTPLAYKNNEIPQEVEAGQPPRIVCLQKCQGENGQCTMMSMSVAEARCWTCTWYCEGLPSCSYRQKIPPPPTFNYRLDDDFA